MDASSGRHRALAAAIMAGVAAAAIAVATRWSLSPSPANGRGWVEVACAGPAEGDGGGLDCGATDKASCLDRSRFRRVSAWCEVEGRHPDRRACEAALTAGQRTRQNGGPRPGAAASTINHDVNFRACLAE